MDGIELALRPDHLGGIRFSSVFSYPTDAAVKAAVNRAENECLPNKDERKRWISSIQRARVHLISHRGGLRELAIDRGAELHFLEIALRRYGA